MEMAKANKFRDLGEKVDQTQSRVRRLSGIPDCSAQSNTLSPNSSRRSTGHGHRDSRVSQESGPAKLAIAKQTKSIEI